jgi:hypothetical protein
MILSFLIQVSVFWGVNTQISTSSDVCRPPNARLQAPARIEHDAPLERLHAYDIASNKE